MAGRFFEILSGLVYARDFIEFDTTNLGAGWVEHIGDWTITSNKLRVTSDSANRIRTAEYDQIDRGEMFVQVGDIDIPNVGGSSEQSGIFLRFDGTSINNADAYLFIMGENASLRLNEYTAGAQTNLGDSTGDPGRTDVDFQGYVADGVQEGWANGETVSAANTAHDGANARDIAFYADTSSGITQAHTFGAVIVCKSKNITIDGLPTGWKGKVLNGSDVVIAQATESGGVATIDCSRFGGCTELMPFGGFAHLITTDAADQEQGRISTNVHAGGTYGYTDAVPVYGSLPAIRFEVWDDVAANGGIKLGTLTGSGVTAARETISVSGTEELELTVLRKSQGWAHLKNRRVIRVVFLNTFDEWRIVKITESEDRDGRLIGKVRCESIRFDLLLGGLLEKIDASPSGVGGVGGLASLHFEVYQQTPTIHSDIILGNLAPFLGPGPTYFTKGTIDPTDVVDMIYDWDTRLSAYDELATVTESELEVIRVGTSTYNVNLLTQRGAGADVPILRIGKNVVAVQHRDSSEKQATVVIPQGAGAEGERTTISENAFEILALPGGNQLQFVDDLVLEDGQLDGMGLYALKPDGSLVQVTASTAPDLVTVANVTGLAATNLITFKRNAAGDDLTALESVASSAVYGQIPEIVARSDIPSVNNLLQNAFFSNWSGGIPDTWTIQGATAIVTQNTNPLYTEYGPSSARFQGQPLDCLIGGPITVTPTETRPHFTAQLNVWVVSGAITLEVWDITDPANVIRYPVDVGNRRSVTSVANNWSTLLLPLPHDFVERDPNSGALQTRQFSFYVCADQPGTEAYIDAAMFTQTAGGVDVFHDGRGSNALWIAGNDHLFLFKDPLSEWQATILDLNSLSPPDYPEEAITVGGNATLWIPHLDDLKILTRILERRRNLLLETDVQIQLATELDLLTMQLEEARRRRKRVRKAVPEQQMPPACGMNPRSWLTGDLVVEWDRPPGAARFEIRDTTATTGTPQQRFEAGVRLALTDDTLWILKDPGQASLPAGTSLPHPSNIGEIIMEAYNHWGVPGACYEVVSPQQLGPAGICLSVITDGSARQTFCHPSPGAAGGTVGIQLRRDTLGNPDPVVVDSSVIAAIIPGQTKLTLCHDGSTEGGSSAVNGYWCPVWSSISGAMRVRLDRIGGTNFPHNFNIYGSAPDVKWSCVEATDNGSGGHRVQIAFGDVPTSAGPDWSSAIICCFEDVPAGQPHTGELFQPGVSAGGTPWCHYMNAHKTNHIEVTGLTNEKIRLTRNFGDAYLGPDVVTMINTVTGTGAISVTDQGDPGGNNHGGGWWDRLEILDSGNSVIDTILGSNLPSGKIWMGSRFDLGSGFDLQSHLAVNFSGTLGLVEDGFIFEENWGVTATAIDPTKYNVVPPASVTYDNQKNALKWAPGGRIMRADKGNFAECVSEAVVEVENLDSAGAGAVVLSGAGLDVQAKLRARFDNGTVIESPGVSTGDLAVFQTDIAFANLIWPDDAQTLTIEQIQTGTGVGRACSKEVRLNVGSVCCPPGGTIPLPGLPPVTVDCLLSAGLKIFQVEDCANGTGVGLAVSGYVKKTNLCKNLDIPGAFFFEAMYFEEYDPANFPDDYVLVRHDVPAGPIPPITGAPQGDFYSWQAYMTTEDPLGLNPTPGTTRGENNQGVAKKWFVRVILRDAFGSGSGFLDTAPVSSTIKYDWCP